MLLIDKNKEFRLESAIFDGMRNDLAMYIQMTPGVMDHRNADSASITLKIDVSNEETVVRDENSPTGERKAVIPNVTYKLTMSMQAKAERKGDVVRAGHELVQDDTGSYYVLTAQEASGQLNMFNAYDELPNERPGKEVAG